MREIKKQGLDMRQELFTYKHSDSKFWKLINAAKGNQEAFYKLIYHLSLDELRAFRREFKWVKLWTKEHSKIIREANREDFTRPIRLFVISQGYEYYKEILENPNKLPLNITEDDPHIITGIVDKVIKEKYATELFDHTDPQNKFWKYIEEAEHKDEFYNLIWHMSLEELRDYEEEFEKADLKLWTGEHYDAMGNIRSEDFFDDTRRYVVSQGYNYYMDVLQHPEKLPQGIDDGNPKLFYGTIGRVMMDRHGDY
ncbi:MAG: DUF4240 domain-containing protein [Bacteroidia bacterium]|nr:DUF4240 domain-containing protein [Bacteroidia bacterium]